MEIVIQQETSWDVKRLNIVVKLSQYISDKFLNSNCGNAIETVYITLNSVNPEMAMHLVGWKDFETGFLIRTKYTKSRKELSFSYKINFADLMATQTTREVINLIIKGLLICSGQIKAMKIKNFNTDLFFGKLIELFNEVTDEILDDIVLKPAVVDTKLYEVKSARPSKKAMQDDEFWELIERAKTQSNGYKEQIEKLIKALSILTQKQIIAFELKFREILSLSSHYNILAAVTIIQDYGSDDSLLYFRCRMMMEGKDFYFKIIDNPEFLAVHDYDFDKWMSEGEDLLSVSNRAFIKKTGINSNKELPSEACIEHFNYNVGEEVYGEEWSKADLPKLFPKLWRKFRKGSTFYYN